MFVLLVETNELFSIPDVVPPTFVVTCPKGTLSFLAERGKCSSSVTWTTPVATDNSADPSVITSNYQPPQWLNKGITVMLYHAVDQSGKKATCSFTIEITCDFSSFFFLATAGLVTRTLGIWDKTPFRR